MVAFVYRELDTDLICYISIPHPSARVKDFSTTRTLGKQTSGLNQNMVPMLELTGQNLIECAARSTSIAMDWFNMTSGQCFLDSLSTLSTTLRSDLYALRYLF